MKNREKFRDEILEYAANPGRDICDFREKEVFTYFGKSGCNGTCCSWCQTLTDLWLDEEYEKPSKPEVDWSKVPVDTLVRVRNRESEDWRLMYFKEFRTDYVFKMHITWKDGKTSKTAEGDCVGWQYCELVEDEDDGSN